MIPPAPPPRHLSMIRGFHLADVLTLGNAACGTLAVFAVIAHVQSRGVRCLLSASALVLLALVLDVLDGRVARWRRRHSAMGRELDSLADVISFGVAPAAIAYGAGLDGAWDVVILLYFVACGVSRLARFNLTAAELATPAGTVEYFEGTPIPSSIVLVGVVAACAWLGRVGDALPLGAVRLGPGQLHPLALLWAVSGSLMISKTLRIPKP
jgi:CDP-diacylglycerol--serine O-phosphatidyltransferase